MSQDQAIGSVIIVAKEMFGLKWKKFDEDQKQITIDTVPDKEQGSRQGSRSLRTEHHS